MARRLILLVCLGLLPLTGCKTAELETGYQPRKLGDSVAARRGYYTPRFTPEARAAQLERDQELDARRPKPGY